MEKGKAFYHPAGIEDFNQLFDALNEQNPYNEENNAI
jgi:hypothetical protein